MVARALSRCTVAEVIDRYLTHASAVGIHCPASLAERLYTLGQFARDHSALRIADCRPFHLADWIEARPSWRSTSTKKAKANQINAVFTCKKTASRQGSYVSARLLPAVLFHHLPTGPASRLLR